MVGDGTRPLSECWQQALACQSMPARADFDPLTIPKISIGQYGFVGSILGPQRLQICLIGTAVTVMLGEDLTGVFVDELAKSTKPVTCPCIETAASREPTAFQDEYTKFAPRVHRKYMMHYK